MKKFLNSHKKKIIAAICLLITTTAFLFYHTDNLLESNFECSRGGYSIDNKRVFYCIQYGQFIMDDFSQMRVKGANAKTFEAIVGSNSYAKDRNHAYYQDEKIQDADPESFEVIVDSPYSKDKNYVFFFAKKIQDADPETFEYISHSYTKDKNHAYYQDEKIQDADPETFEVILDSHRSYPNSYAKDKNNFYLREEIIDNIPEYLR